MPNSRPSPLQRVALVLACGFVAVAAIPERGGPLLVISIDGLRPDYVREADRYGLRIPALRRLLREGSSASGVLGVLPTVTYPSHATLVTGVAPARHGILANRPFDPLGTNREGWYWYAEDLRVQTLWDAAAEAGLRTSSVDWPVTVGARIDWNVPQVWRADTADDTKLVRAVSTPGLLAEAERAIGPWPFGSAGSVERDRRKAAFSAWLLRAKKSRLHFAYFASLDEEQHRSGPGSPATLRTLEALDGIVGELRRAAESVGTPTIAVVSDHGFARADQDLFLNEALRREGLLTRNAAGEVRAWRAQAWLAGGTVAILLKDPHDEAARRRVRALLARLQGERDSAIERVLSEGEALASGGFPGAAFVVGLRPEATHKGHPARPSSLHPVSAVHGEHGYLPENHEMDATFVIAGPAVPAGADFGRIDMRDVAPTLAARLGLFLPAAEGHDRLDLKSARF